MARTSIDTTATAKATTAKVTEITTKVTTMLTPLNSEDRRRVISASLTLLGEQMGDLSMGSDLQMTHGTGATGGKPGQTIQGLQPKAGGWLSRSKLTKEQLEQVFEIAESGVTVIGVNVPGKSAKEKTINAFVLEGIARLLASGEPAFDDKAARALCVSVGCFNSANHSVYMEQKGNLFTGSKDKGWKLTAPGLARGSELVKEMTKAE